MKSQENHRENMWGEKSCTLHHIRQHLRGLGAPDTRLDPGGQGERLKKEFSDFEDFHGFQDLESCQTTEK